jgi:hypothetical protein
MSDETPSHEFRARRVTIDPQPLDADRIIYPVPTSPISTKFTRAVCIAPKDDPMAIESTTLIIERRMVEKFAAFLAGHGAIDREPTASEMNVLMQTVSSALATMQIEAMSIVSEALFATLGDPSADPSAIEDTVSATMADNATREAIAQGMPREQAEEFRADFLQRLKDYAARKLRDIGEGPDVA